MKTIEMNFNVEFAGQAKELSIIPAGNINKTVCGCGITSRAIEGCNFDPTLTINTENVVIAMPNISLVDNKANQYPNGRYNGKVLGISGSVSVEDIREYVKERRALNERIVLLTTYDSLWKCEEYLDESHLIVDESDRLIATMGMKLASKKPGEIDANTKLLNIAKRYKETVTFVSATVIPLEFMPKWVSEINQVTMNWANTVSVRPITIENQYPFKVLRQSIIKPINRDGQITLHTISSNGDNVDVSFKKVIVFINSVQQIIKTIKEAQLSKNDVAILCSDDTRNDISIRGYNRIEAYDKLPKYTFITSSGFQGIDLSDPEAMSIVVSNTTRSHQMLNMLTDLKQATSRQRNKNNPNYNKYVYIYNQNDFDKSEEELLSIINDTEERIISNCSTLNDYKSANDSRYNLTLKTFSESTTFNTYSLSGEKWGINEFAFNADKYFILQTHKQYTKGFDIIGNLDNSPLKVKLEAVRGEFSYITLLEKFKHYIKFGEDTFTEKEKSSENYEIISTYYNYYKSYTMNSSYAKKRIKAFGDEYKQLVLTIREIFIVGTEYSLKDVKARLNGIYKEFGITKKAKATDLLQYFKSVKQKRATRGKVMIINK